MIFLKKWVRRKVVDAMPRLDIGRISDCASMIGFVDDFSEPSRTKFREKYAREILHIIHEHEREVSEWADGREKKA